MTPNTTNREELIKQLYRDWTLEDELGESFTHGIWMGRDVMRFVHFCIRAVEKK